MKNYIKEFMKENNIEIGEWVCVKTDKGSPILENYKIKFNEDYDLISEDASIFNYNTLKKLLEGKYKIQKKSDNIWNIKYKEKYLFIDIDGKIQQYDWRENKDNKNERKYNNAFKSKEKAKYEQIKRKYEAKLRQANEQAWYNHDEDLNWENGEQLKWVIEYDHLEGRITTVVTDYLAYLPNYYYFPTRESAQKFIEENRELIEDFFTYWEEE